MATLFSISVASNDPFSTCSNCCWKQNTPAVVVQQQDILSDEYLHNNYGYIWTGNVAIPWNYAVGSEVVTASRQRLVGLMSSEETANRLTYSRALTRVINEYVLHGRWNGNYGDGIEPTRWVGSEDILARWL